jgi:ADP-ribose pyrophosphatase
LELKMETLVFLAGLAAEPSVRRLILGDHEARPARISGLGLAAAVNGPWPVAVRHEGAADGVLVSLDAAQSGRLDFALRALGLTPEDLTAVSARTWLGQGTGPASKVDQTVLAVVNALLPDILVLHGMVPPEAVASRLHAMLVRAASTCRAAEASLATLRHDAARQDVTVAAFRLPYAHFFSVEEYDLSWRRFDGTPSETVTRATFILGDAVTVLPYDPVRDRVLVVEQFRAGPLARGDGQGWQIEAIAGRVDPFETPEEAARREAVEEAGLILTDLIPVARYYPSPGAVSEYLFSYLALTDLPDGSAGVFGVEGEAEDIRGHLIAFDRLMELVASGEIANAPLILTALWLQRERPRLRQDGQSARPAQDPLQRQPDPGAIAPG